MEQYMKEVQLWADFLELYMDRNYVVKSTKFPYFSVFAENIHDGFSILEALEKNPSQKNKECFKYWVECFWKPYQRTPQFNDVIRAVRNQYPDFLEKLKEANPNGKD